MSTSNPELRKVQRAADKAALAREALELAIRELHAEGTSLRDLARVTGMSHETIRRICKNAVAEYVHHEPWCASKSWFGEETRSCDCSPIPE